jgi:hypothetical protein
MRSAILLLLCCQLASAVSVKFRVVDEGGSPVKDVLVIVDNLESHEAEVLRVLTNDRGEAGVLWLQPGLYRMIATAPYGLWQTRIKEFLVKSGPLEVVLPVKVMPTHGYGDIIVVGAPTLELQIVQSDGHPASFAQVLMRDKVATLHTEKWYKADSEGRVKAEMMADEPVVAVILYQDAIMTTELPSHATGTVIRFSPN